MGLLSLFRRRTPVRAPLAPEEQLYILGVPNPDLIGIVHHNMLMAKKADFTEQVEALCRTIGVESRYLDHQAYQVEITAATLNEGAAVWAWMESRARMRMPTRSYVNISFELKLWRNGKILRRCKPRSYNPFFGCVVGYMRWHDDILVTIYTEKHHAYAFTMPIKGKPTFDPIGIEWKVNGDLIGFRDPLVKGVLHSVELPNLRRRRISKEEADSLGILPDKVVACSRGPAPGHLPPS